MYTIYLLKPYLRTYSKSYAMIFQKSAGYKIIKKMLFKKTKMKLPLQLIYMNYLNNICRH